MYRTWTNRGCSSAGFMSGGGQVRSLSPASRKATFDGVRTGAEVTVQMTIVVDTTDGDYLISDILKAGIHQSLTNPAFRDHFRRWPGADSDPEPTGGIFYFVGYNENFTNYRAVAGESFATISAPERLRIGLAHGGEDDARDAVGFDANRLRITDGNMVPEGDDVNTIAAAETARRGSSNTAMCGQLWPGSLPRTLP